MSCSFEKLQFLEYYQEKKIIFLEFSPPSRCPEKETVSQSSPGNAVCRQMLLLNSYFLPILKPLEEFKSKEFKYSDCCFLTMFPK
jgi:hypothetical protein